MKRSKVLERLVKSDHRLDSYSCEPDGHFLYCKSGYIFSSSECVTERADTVAELLKDCKGIEKGVFENGFTRPMTEEERANDSLSTS